LICKIVIAVAKLQNAEVLKQCMVGLVYRCFNDCMLYHCQTEIFDKEIIHHTR